MYGYAASTCNTYLLPKNLTDNVWPEDTIIVLYVLL